MAGWLARRTAHAAVTWAGAVVALFLLLRLLPGDPLASAADLPPETRLALAHLYGVDQPLLTQLGHFTAGLLHGDLGTSVLYGRPVVELLAAHLPATLLLGLAVLLTDFGLAWWLGNRLAARAGSRADRWANRALLAGHALPPYWLGLLLIWPLALTWGLLPAAGLADPLLPAGAGATRALDVARHLVLPWLTLTLTTLAVPLRHHREAVYETLASDWVRAARARGVPEGEVLARHGARPSLGPLLALVGAWLPMALTGSLLVEGVFAWPGIGWLMAESVGGRDLPLATGCAALGALAAIGGMWLADVLHRLLDPRVAA
ncbi:MAG TPA: ABC transporter permease [Gemmatimonadales bacterium]|nr:ABC transporter permease [Gemmatimonadales bacterium]